MNKDVRYLSEVFDSLGNRSSSFLTFQLGNREIYLKYNEKCLSNLTGNKLWKLYQLYEEKEYFTHLVSYGSPQSNALRAMAYFAHIYQKKMIYFVHRLPSKETIHPESNLAVALRLGAEVQEVEAECLRSFSFNYYTNKMNKGSLARFVLQGIEGQDAKKGMERIAKEIKEDLIRENIDVENLCVCLPAGTGTSAFYLRQFLECPVVCTPCISNKAYLLQQFNSFSSKGEFFPLILESKKNYSFGKLYIDFFELYKQMKTKVNIEFDLLYDMKMLTALKENLHELPKTILYLHCGGQEGNASMLARYQRKFS
jgi:1-aminocyclopropane-1-carboxylate deaminase